MAYLWFASRGSNSPHISIDSDVWSWGSEEPLLQGERPPFGQRPVTWAEILAIVALTEAVLIAFAQGLTEDDGYRDLYLQMSAAASAAGIFWQLQKSTHDIRILLGYLTKVIVVVELVESMNGFGSPCVGQELSGGEATFSHEILDILQGADAIDWSGGGALEYNSQNAAQRDRVVQISAADRKVAQCLAVQAAQVKRGREELAAARLVAVAGFIVASNLVAVLPAPSGQGEGCTPGEAYHMMAEQYIKRIAAVLVFAALTLIITLIVEGIKTQHALDSALAEYQGVVDDIEANVPIGTAMGDGGRAMGVQRSRSSDAAGLPPTTPSRLHVTSAASDSRSGGVPMGGVAEALSRPTFALAAQSLPPEPSGRAPSAPVRVSRQRRVATPSAAPMQQRAATAPQGPAAEDAQTANDEAICLGGGLEGAQIAPGGRLSSVCVVLANVLQ